MSLRALLWVVDDPRCSTLHASALRVLLALADHAHEDGTSAWVSASRMAQRLSISERTVERCIAQLRETGLIRRGDQTLVASRRADRRPVVWDLDVAGNGGRTVTDDGSSDQDEHDDARADTADGPKSDGPSRNASRADTNPVNGPTPGVGQNRPLTIKNRPARERARGAATAATRAAARDLTALDDVEAHGDVTYCRRCSHQHAPDAACTRAMLPVPQGGLRALRDAARDAS